MVVACGSNSARDLVSFFRIPSEYDNHKQFNKLASERRKAWINRLKRADLTESKIKMEEYVPSILFQLAVGVGESIPQEIEEAATRAILDLLPTKSKKQYELAYKRFAEWCDRNNVSDKYSENVILDYFEQNSKIWKSSTLWAHFLMIKAMLNVENNQDIKAPDDKYLMFKVVAVMGILGACRHEELCQMSLNNIEDSGNTLVVNIPDSKTKVSRTLTVITETYIDLYRKYLALRPAHVNHQRLFIKYTST
ncbi:hypothetical protein NQ317_007196 [Molorchus minor]|uniref:Uncharacterized protein n=1 Tax=Molorchus minor TaxID=1323400 RepID=A0ABQ9ISY5_9CUCU|nr:hypothetical protein NQ317_007196 [Molorchus minor]